VAGVASDVTVVGVIGSPITHSLSPLLHDTAFAVLGVPWVSHAFEVPAGRAADAMADMRAIGLAGLSVTMPHKGDVYELMDECSPEATLLRAVNCIVARDGRLRGENTDGAGFLASLERGADFSPAGKRCLVIGAGGAARAVAVALAGAGASEVAVVNRTAERATALVHAAGGVVRLGAFDDETEVAQADLVVNATPIGMGPDAAAGQWPVDPALLHPGQVVADLIYDPRPTAWLVAAGDRGALAVDGLGMLVHQAAAQITLWTGLDAPVDAMWEAVAGR
ncbi:MAG TPA: shikimate dehydrogenase, partial [Acidimicrobiales bacterium]|nr:shikimate dehydrogenase [Acidimicrobiales bacterium]